MIIFKIIREAKKQPLFFIKFLSLKEQKNENGINLWNKREFNW
jgi:hypothetical protein